VSIAVTTIMISVEDVDRAKKFYSEGLGATVDQDYKGFARLNLGEGSSSLAIYEREAAAKDAGVPAEGSGFRGVSFHHIVPERTQVDDVMASASAAGADIVKPAAAARWGGYFGYFSDPDGHLWKVACAS
jgi:uncharacterized glyoxalase superfamily protein PhnB